MSDPKHLPELLCPAGCEESLCAAIEGGADAVYLGGSAMNARIHAGNFDPDALRAAVRRAHAYGVKVYLTLNTLITDRELGAYLDAALDASRAGVDALIVADVGGAALIHRAIPQMELHASTQMSGHNSMMAAELQELGFSRMVAAREISEGDLRLLMQRSPIEIELFVHGALCVSQSGQCLFSSIVGGRSGNRGECAQPCRLPYGCGGKDQRERYPLSLKDLSLASHLPDLIGMGVHSLKIEGRMKSPEYVYETARIWRRLLDERRAATPKEISRMAEAFSRDGFTDGYYTGRIDRSMLGVRREADKQTSRAIEPFGGLQRKIPISLEVSLRAGMPVSLTLSDGVHTVTETGEIPEAARTAPMTEESVLRSLCRFGATPYLPTNTKAEVEDGLMMPVSRLNDLRRRATEALETATALPVREEHSTKPCSPRADRKQARSARFAEVGQITEEAREYFERIYLPLFSFAPPANGVVIPPVIFDGAIPEAEQALKHAAKNGARYALVGNLGHLKLARRAGLIPVGDFRLNACNRESAALLEKLGFEELILSPELTLPQMRDVGGNTSAMIYGRLPLMTLEKCVIRELADCNACTEGRVELTDRRGVRFPVLREWEHRNVVYNSLPTCMSDQSDRLARAGLTNRHFLFSVESPTEVNAVISAHREGRTLGIPVRRIGG